jgi:hypothetical protein
MDSVTQKHDMACGLACVSFVTGVPYEQFTEAISDEQLNTIGFYCPELVELLGKNGLKYAWMQLPETETGRDFKPGDIVFVERSKQLPYGHFLTKTSGGWMDPWINLTGGSDIAKARSGFRPSLPGRAEYLVYPTISN